MKYLCFMLPFVIGGCTASTLVTAANILTVTNVVVELLKASGLLV